MSSDARKFRFISPGIFLNEIDQSQIPSLPEPVGPVVIGRAERGPGMVPTKVNSFSEFVEVFGEPISGKNSHVTDVWREGNYAAPTYAAYAAQAYLNAGVGPVTFVRLMGTQHPDATTAGQAGYTTTNNVTTDVATNGGPYGLFVWASGAIDDADPYRTSMATSAGTLAAVFYMDSGVPILSGNTIYGGPDGLLTTAGAAFASQEAEGTATVIKSDPNGNFRMRILDSSSAEVENVKFSLAESSNNFIRKVFNTNPQLVNTTIEYSSVQKNYWLGETFERYTNAQTLDTAVVRYGAILALVSGSSLYGNHERDMPYRDGHTGWYFAQNTSVATASYEYHRQQKLFKFVGINGYGEWLQNNIKISIDNIRASSNEFNAYGTFDVALRKASDSDLKKVELERFSGLTLNPNSPDYIARRIGDISFLWDEDEKRYRELGANPNQSKYVRVVVHDEIDNGGADPAFLPFGVFGPPRFRGWTSHLSGTTFSGQPSRYSYALGSSSIAFGLHRNNYTGYGNSPDHLLYAGPARDGELGTGRPTGYGTASITYPAVGTRDTATADGANPTKNAYFGLHTGKTAASTVHDPGFGDYLKSFGYNIISDNAWSDQFGLSTETHGLPSGSHLERQWVFSLDEVVVATETSFATANPSNLISQATWTSGSMKAGTSWNASSSIATADYENILKSKINRFTSPLWGGHDGLDITEREPFRDTRIDDAENETGNYTYYTIKRAINTVSDAEVVQTNAITIPGLKNESLTKYLVDAVEERADALAIIDIDKGYTPRADDTSTNKMGADRRGDLPGVLTSFKARNLNSSYGAAYYPWVRVRDDLNGGVIVHMPPSVVALGVLGSCERSSDVWFAPAGFRRGGLSTGAGGLNVVGVETKLTSRNRDDLYDININPIASFPAEGIVVFGQKTLQATQSALDRINVRRLMIYVKRGISRIASQTLFQPNVQATWNSFKSKADNFLSDVKVRFGVDDFRVILDETTTTPDLIDRNIMYAKIFIKPTRSIEFIAIDFIITRSGASFED